MNVRGRRLAALVLALSVAACEGPVGPEGPQGPEGPPGPRGPAAEVDVVQAEGTIPSTGGVAIRFAGFTLSLATVNCWISETGQQWIKVAFDTSTSVACGARQEGSDLIVSMLGPAGWRYLMVVMEPMG